GLGATLPLILLLVLATAFRLYGLQWDGGHWLHPDERQIYFVVMGLGWPDSLAQALSPASPLNPQFFAYGSLPIYLLGLVAYGFSAIWPAAGQLDNLHLVGRPLAILFDLGTIYLTYRLARRLFSESGTSRQAKALALLSAGLVSVAVLQIQLAHFYTVDPLLTFFVMLALNLASDVAQCTKRAYHLGLGAVVGLAVATKLSAIPLVLIIPVAYNIQLSHHDTTRRSLRQRLLSLARPTVSTLAVAVAVFVLTQPYILIDWQTFVQDTFMESDIARGTMDVPYTVQYAGTVPFLYSIWQTALWGLGPPLGLLAWAGLVFAIYRWLRRGAWADTLVLAWAGPYFAITGLLYTRYLRYMSPLVPVLCILAVRLLVDLARHRPLAGSRRSQHWYRTVLALGGGLATLTALYAVLFAVIYTEPHSWIRASEWLYRHAAAGSTLAIEHWDRALPLPMVVDGEPRNASQYESRTLSLYDEPDDESKWQMLASDLAASDYLIIASRRLYGSIPRAADRYPATTRYYNLLFAGSLGFEPVAEFTRGPEWLNPRLPPLPQAAPSILHPDESFVVYDHPRALLYHNVQHLPADALLQRLGLGDG
ncbi:MAG: glycosyltransferase family 39 protein, partial [Anaerolineae bacterium]